MKHTPSVGGVSNTPPQILKNTNYESISELIENLDLIPETKTNPVRVLFDWLSYTFDDLDYLVEVDHTGKRRIIDLEYNHNNDCIMSDLFYILGLDTNWKKHPKEHSAINGYTFTYRIGEHIRIMFGGPESVRLRPTTQFLLSGQACREYENYYRMGNKTAFYEIFMFLTGLNGRCTRIDTAFDVFDRNILDIYALKRYAKYKWWRGYFRTLTIHDQIGFGETDDESDKQTYEDDSIDNDEGLEIYSKGYSLTFGVMGSNQVQFYDKKLERLSHAKDKTMYDDEIISDIWYRCEMRLTDDKAQALIYQYLNAFKESDEFQFSKFASEILNGLITFIEPVFDILPNGKKRIKNNGKNNRNRWEMMPMWENFIGSVERVKLHRMSSNLKTIRKKKEWAEKSLETTFAQFLLSNGTMDQYFLEHLEYCLSGLDRLDDKMIVSVNKYLSYKHMNPITMEQISNYKELIKQKIASLESTVQLDLIHSEMEKQRVERSR